MPSGVWAANEYEKLIDYDNPTSEQPLAAFYCHTSPDFLCTGWAQVHALDPKRGYEPISLRFAILFGEPLEEIPAPTVPLFESGRAAAEHGMRDIEAPSPSARRAVAKVEAARARRPSRRRHKHR